jgi:hypothetical protein
MSDGVWLSKLKQALVEQSHDALGHRGNKNAMLPSGFANTARPVNLLLPPTAGTNFKK